MRQILATETSSAAMNVTSVSIDLPEMQGPSPQQIAQIKCSQAIQQLMTDPKYSELLQNENDAKTFVLTEDTCLCFNAMQGLPGPYIKWFLQKLGHEGLNRMLNGWSDKSAYALCIFAMGKLPSTSSKEQQENVMLFEGRTDGTIVDARGPHKFGWDPIFQPDGFAETYAEMDKQVKNTISHRYRALMQVQQYLSTNASK